MGRHWHPPLEEDGEFDEQAVGIAASGERYVKLTMREIEAAAKLIIQQGGCLRTIRERLRVPERRAAILAREAGFDMDYWNRNWSMTPDGRYMKNVVPSHPERQRYITRHGGKAWKKEESVAGMVVSTGGPGASFRT